MTSTTNQFCPSVQNLPIGAFQESGAGVLEMANEKYLDTLGLTNGQQTLISWRDLVIDEDKETALNEWEKAIKGKRAARINCRLRKTNGNVIWADIRINPIVGIDNKLIGFSGILIDITNQTMFEKVLERFKKAVEKTESQIIFTDSDGLVVYANEAVEKVTGFTSGEVIGTKAGTLWGGLMDKNFYTKMWKKIKVDNESFEGELINKKKGGETYFAQVTITPILDAKSEVEFFVSIERDITYIKEMDKVKNEFISLASHQLRTPLSSIKWLCELFWQNNANQIPQEQRSIMEKVQSENERLIKLVNSLLNVSRIESNKIDVNPSLTDVGELIERTVSGVRPLLDQKKQTIEVKLPPELPKLFLDTKLVGEALTNLVSNSSKYTAGGGRIWIKAKVDGSDLLISITDNGIGISKDEQHRVFEKFFRASNAIISQTDGNGLGLYFVKWVIESHGGKIWFESTENVGTTFYIAFPLKPKS